MTAPRIAVIVPVLDEADNIAALLGDLRHQERAPDEVLIVDAGSTDGTQAIVEALVHDLPGGLLLHRQGATPGAGRNAGIAHTRAEVVATIDAGSRVGRRWLAALAAPVLDDPRAVATGVAVADARSSFERAAGWFTLRAFKPPDAPGPVGRSFLPAGRNGLCLSRAMWERAGGYPPELPWGEDKRFLHALREAGCNVRIAPEAEVRWRPRRSPAEMFRQYQRYGRGDAMAKIDRQNELVPMAMMGAAAMLAVRAARGDRRARTVLVAAATGYVGIFTVSAARELDDARAVAWVPAVRLLVDVAKVSGFLGHLSQAARDRLN